jgi:hypothetical protein
MLTNLPNIICKIVDKMYSWTRLFAWPWVTTLELAMVDVIGLIVIGCSEKPVNPTQCRYRVICDRDWLESVFSVRCSTYFSRLSSYPAKLASAALLADGCLAWVSSALGVITRSL